MQRVLSRARCSPFREYDCRSQGLPCESHRRVRVVVIPIEGIGGCDSAINTARRNFLPVRLSNEQKKKKKRNKKKERETLCICIYKVTFS